MHLPRSVLIAVTSASAPLYPSESGGSPNPTGLFISEALHPFTVFRDAGFSVDFISEKGTYTPDYLSVSEDTASNLSKGERDYYENPTSDFRTKLDSMLTASQVSRLDAERYGMFFAAGGHAAMIDFPDATELQRVASVIWGAGGVVGAVCHGPAILGGVISPRRESIARNNSITGFTTKGEEELGVMKDLKKWGRKTIEEMAQGMGAKYVPPPGPWNAFAHTDGRLVTGANPASAKATAEACLAAFEKHEE